jgi:hypothetical protein
MNKDRPAEQHQEEFAPIISGYTIGIEDCLGKVWGTAQSVGEIKKWAEQEVKEHERWHLSPGVDEENMRLGRPTLYQCRQKVGPVLMVFRDKTSGDVWRVKVQHH